MGKSKNCQRIKQPDCVCRPTHDFKDGMLVAGARLGQKRNCFRMERTCTLAHGFVEPFGLESQMDRSTLARRRGVAQTFKSQCSFAGKFTSSGSDVPKRIQC